MNQGKQPKGSQKARRSAQEYIGLKEVTDNGVTTLQHGEIAFFRVKPVNLAVLSPNTISAKVFALTNVLKTIPELFICCLNSAESFDDNKMYLQERIANEDNSVIKDLCRNDLGFLDDIQMESATSREFVIGLNFRANRQDQMVNEKMRLEKVLKEQGFEAKRASKSEIKRLLSIYYGHRNVDEELPDMDGEDAVQKWIIPD